MFLYPFAFDPAFLINFHASVFWFCVIFSEEDSWFFYFYCVLFHVCGLCVRISVEPIVKCEMPFCVVASSADPEGGQGVRTLPPLENHKLYGFQQGISNWTPPPLEKVGPPGKNVGLPSGTLKMIVFFGINHLTSVK